MHYRFFLFAIAFSFSSIFAGPIEYSISPAQGNSHILHIEIKISGSRQQMTSFRMPAWRPGRYVIQNFARNVLKFSVADGQGNALPFHKTDKDTWQVKNNGAATVIARYDYYAAEFDGGNSYYDDREIYLNPITCLMYIPGREMEPASLFIENKNRWPVATALPYNAKSGKFSAENYHELADSPIVISPHFSMIEFKAGGRPHEIMMLGDYRYDEKRISGDFRKMIEASKNIFGELPTPRYVFFYHLVDYRYGHGVEHKNSTAIVSGPANFADPGYYRSFLGVATHEYFHLWNVERIRPAAILLPDYSKERYSENFWFFEGVTSYYTPVVLQRAGLLKSQKFLREFAGAINAYRQNYGRKVTSPAKSSFESWTHSMGRTPPNSQLSFYLTGKLLGMALDLEIRHQTKNKKSLDDVMHLLWQNFGRQNIGVPENGIQKAVEKISGTSFQAFFDNFVYAANPIDFERILPFAGLEMQRDLQKDSAKVYLGLSLAGDKKQTIVRNVRPESPGWKAGLDLGDVLVAINGRRIYKQNFHQFLARFEPGDSLDFAVLRGEYLRHFNLILEAPPQEMQTIKLVPLENADELQLKIRDNWAGKLEKKKK